MQIILNEEDSLNFLNMIEENKELKDAINILKKQIERYVDYKDKYESLLLYGAKLGR